MRLAIRMVLWLYSWLYSHHWGCTVGCVVAMWLVRGTYLHWLYVGHKKLGVGCVLVVCVGRMLVGPILVVTYDHNPGFGGRRLVVRVLRPSYDQSIKKIRRRS